MEPITRRYDFVLYFDVQDGNPNGDPDAGNLPRVDAETGIGLVTDVCLKRKVRNYVLLTKENRSPYEIYVKEKAILNEQHKRAYQAIGAGEMVEKKEAKKRTGGDVVEEARQWMCQTFYDIRAFGGCHDHRDQLWPSAWTDPDDLCAFGRADRYTGALDYTHGGDDRRRSSQAAR